MPDDIAVSCAKMAEPIEIPFGLWTGVAPSKHVLHGMHIGAIWQIRLNCPCSAALQKRLNQSRCCLGCALGWAQGTILDGGPDHPVPRGNFQWKGRAWACLNRYSAVSSAKMA